MRCCENFRIVALLGAIMLGLVAEAHADQVRGGEWVCANALYHR